MGKMARALIILFICASVAVIVSCHGQLRDCEDVLRTSTLPLDSAVYLIEPLGFSVPFEIYCDFETDGEGWTVIQRRLDDSVNFDRVWSEYKEGFGDFETEFWLGNDKMSALTTQKSYQLRIELTGSEGPHMYAQYTHFRVADEGHYYKLLLGTFSGTAAVDSMDFHRDMNFSTKDADHDRWSDNCAGTYERGGWWYNSCYHVNLNAVYVPNQSDHSIQWNDLQGGSRALVFTEMKIRAI